MNSGVDNAAVESAGFQSCSIGLLKHNHTSVRIFCFKVPRYRATNDSCSNYGNVYLVAQIALL